MKKKANSDLFLFAIFSVLASCFFYEAESHARLLVPPARSSCWREFPECPRWDTDNELSCGGAGVQHQTHGGRCGICGKSKFIF